MEKLIKYAELSFLLILHLMGYIFMLYVDMILKDTEVIKSVGLTISYKIYYLSTILVISLLVASTKSKKIEKSFLLLTILVTHYVLLLGALSQIAMRYGKL